MIVYEVFFWDNTTLELSEAKGEVIKQAWLSGKKVPFEYEGNGYSVGDIKRVKKVFRKETTPIAMQLPVGTVELPDEKREHNLQVIAKMREDFLKKQRTRKGEA